MKIADGRLVLVKQKWYPTRTALHTMWGSVVMDPVSYAVLPVKEDIQIPNEITVALMRLPVHLGPKTLQEAKEKQTRVFHFGVVQGCCKNTIPEPLIIFDIRMQQLDPETLCGKRLSYQSSHVLYSTAPPKLRYCQKVFQTSLTMKYAPKG